MQEKQPLQARPTYDWGKALKMIKTRKYSDAQIAEAIGSTRKNVANYRTRHGFPATPAKPPIDWQQWDKLLGTMPDEQLAKQIKRSTYTVQDRRTGLKIPAFAKPRKNTGTKVNIPEPELKQLLKQGKTLAEIATHFGASHSAIQNAKRKFGLMRPNNKTAEYKPISQIAPALAKKFRDTAEEHGPQAVAKLYLEVVKASQAYNNGEIQLKDLPQEIQPLCAHRGKVIISHVDPKFYQKIQEMLDGKRRSLLDD